MADEEDKALALRRRAHTLVFPVTDGSPFRVPANADELLHRFLASKAEQTRQNYGYDLACFARFVGVDSPAEAINGLLGSTAPEAHAALLAYQTHLAGVRFYERGDDPEKDEPYKIGYAPKTIRRRVSALQSVVKLANTFGLVTWKLQVHFKRESAPVKDTRGPGPQTYLRLLQSIEAAVQSAPDDQARATALRDLVVVRMLHDCRIRRVELTRIEWPRGVRLGDKPSVEILGKGSRYMWKPLAAVHVDLIRRYLELRGRKRGYLLLGRLDRPTARMDPSTVNRLVTRWASAIGENFTPHSLGHTAITTALDKEEGNFRIVSRWSGHEDQDSLRPYDDRRLQDARRITEYLADPANHAPHDEA